ncbi:hypothetical protein DH2020_029357 [Rehmannia glutinosa]|uniref:HTH OST-type domain-containing protein n=1 Tax=Rehmannia glutinosa TaxID=99300 RepID=A0ABR0VPL7_REHGL
MSTSNTSALALPSEYSEQGINQMSISNTITSHQTRSSLHGPVSILWDIENCPVPSDVRPEDVAGNIRMALRVHPVIDGAVTMFSAYGDFNSFPRRLREGCQRTGVKLIGVPNGRKDAADKAILVDMFLFSRQSSTVIDHAYIRRCRFVWDWPSVARGEGFVPPAKPLKPEISGFLMGCQINDDVEGQNEEESIVYRGSQKALTVLESIRWSYSVPSGLNEVLMGNNFSSEQNDVMWVQPGDLNGLKGQLVKLLEMSGGNLPLTRLPAEYQKIYGRPLYVSEYGVFKLVNLLKKMVDVIAVEGKGQRKNVCLRNIKSEPVCPPVILARREKKGKEVQEDNNIDVMGGARSSDEISDDERENNEYNLETIDRSQIIDDNLKNFRYELQEILVSYSCRIFLGSFEAIYYQRYKRQLDYPSRCESAGGASRKGERCSGVAKGTSK